jgi:hypothetical protein
MRHRLYFTLPGIPSLSVILEELLLAGIDKQHLHFFAREGILPAAMPKADFLHKSDLIHGSEVAILTGGGVGLCLSAVLVLLPPEGMYWSTLTVLLAALGSALLGFWLSVRIAAAIPEARLQALREAIEQGHIVLMIDVPFTRVKEIENRLSKRDPEIRFGGVEPSAPAFRSRSGTNKMRTPPSLAVRVSNGKQIPLRRRMASRPKPLLHPNPHPEGEGENGTR